MQVEDSMVRYSYGIGDYSQGTIYQDAVKVDDYRWHNITLEREDRSVTLQIDEDGKKRNFNNGLPHDFTGLEVDSLILGGTPKELVIDERELSGESRQTSFVPLASFRRFCVTKQASGLFVSCWGYFGSKQFFCHTFI